MDRQEVFDDAVEHARWYVEFVREEGDWDNPGELSAGYFEAMPADWKSEYVRKLIGRSDQQSAWDLLAKIAANALRRDQTPVPELGYWAAENLDRTKKRPTKGRPRSRDRDVFLWHLISSIMDYFDLPATKGKDYETASACGAVA